MNEKTIEFAVLSREKIGEFSTDRAYLHISVRDPGAELAVVPDNPNQVARLDLEFSDIDLSIFIDDKKIKSFTIEDAKSILEVVRLTEKYINLIVINCEAGISRSAAIAAALAKLLGQDDKKFFRCYCPNRYVYRTILNTGMDTKPIGA